MLLLSGRGDYYSPPCFLWGAKFSLFYSASLFLFCTLSGEKAGEIIWRLPAVSKCTKIKAALIPPEAALTIGGPKITLVDEKRNLN